jgi:hypothetical protein
MSQPTHEPPDPELWGRLCQICHDLYGDGEAERAIISRHAWSILIGVDDYAVEYEGQGPTWNDAARALIAEWEGRSK